MRLLTPFIITMLSLSICRADMREIEARFRAILSQADGARVPRPEDLAGLLTGNTLQDATPEQIKVILPLGRMCLESANSVIRRDGMLLLYGVSMARLDNAVLLAPYFETVASFLNDPDTGQKQGAIGILANGYPTPAPQAVAYLVSFLTDEQNTGDQFLTLSSAVLMGSPADNRAVRVVLTALKRRPDHDQLARGMIQGLAQDKVFTDDALEFIRSGFSDSRALVRQTSVEAVSRMPADSRSRFSLDLQRLLTNPDELPEVKSLAGHVLVQ